MGVRRLHPKSKFLSFTASPAIAVPAGTASRGGSSGGNGGVGGAPSTPSSGVRGAGPALDRINDVNTALMLLSAALAFALPFELFLAAYAVLGPLHYLTQLSWLHDRRCFTTGRFDGIPLALLALFSLDAVYLGWVRWEGTAFAALALGAAAAFVRSPLLKLAALAASVAVSLPLVAWKPGNLLFAGLLPTVIHVYVFTGLFILAGSLRSRSRSGYASLAVFLACGAGLLLVPAATAYEPSGWALANLDAFSDLFDSMSAFAPSLDTRAGLLAVGRFLAFAYTYHYLNWFSKTGVIRWHEVSRVRMALLGVLWAASVGLYAWDYALGLAVLFTLSVMHVFLEFPLDVRTLVAVVRGAP